MSPVIRLALVIGTAQLLPLLAHAGQLQEMVKSSPAFIDGFEFVATAESVWSLPQPYQKNPVEIQLLITNRVGRDRVFPVFDTFALHLKDATGHELPAGGGRDHTLMARPVMIRAGDTYCLSRVAAIARDHTDNIKISDFSYEDGTGSWAVWRNIQPGSYTLSFSIACDGLDSQTQFFSKVENFDWTPYLIWTGHGVTHDLSFRIVNPPSQ